MVQRTDFGEGANLFKLKPKHPENKDDEEKRVKLPTGGSSSTSLPKSRVASNSRTPSMGCSFWTGIYNSLSDLKRDDIEGKESMIIELLQKLNFELETEPEDPFFSIQIDPSRSVSVILKLTRDLELIQFQEKNLRWVHATLVSCQTRSSEKGFLQHPDMRITFSSHHSVPQNSDLYKYVYPRGNPIQAKVQFLLDGLEKKVYQRYP
jgi:hypothetical protein